MAKQKGLLITFEGPDGGGKSTQARRLAAWLRRQGKSVVLTRDPGGTAVGNRLRRIVLDARQKQMTATEELFLYMAARSALVQEIVLPALQEGKIVLIDRFQDSTWVYQGWAGKMDLKLIDTLGQSATRGRMPDLTFILDVPATRGLDRVKHPNRMEAKGLGFHRKVRAGFLALAKRERKRVHVVDATQPIQVVQENIREAVSRVV